MKSSNKIIKLIGDFEGMKTHSYQDHIGVWTIGKGTTEGITPGLIINEAIADKLLAFDLQKFEDYVNTVFAEIEFTQYQFDALVSLSYNIGFSFGTTLKNAVRIDFRKVPDAIRLYNKAGGKVSQGLVNRRNDEVNLFETGKYLKTY